MPEQSHLEISRLGPGQESVFAAFLEEIGSSEERIFFHPHPFDASTAARVCGQDGKDLYYAAFFGGRILAYGLLRGWDEGYEIPSLGIYVAPSFRSKGLGDLMVRFLHVSAVVRGATRVRLRVHRENVLARKFYERLGYTFAGVENGLDVGICDLGILDRGRGGVARP